MTTDYQDELLTDAAKVVATDLYPERCRTLIESVPQSLPNRQEYARHIRALSAIKREAGERPSPPISASYWPGRGVLA